MSTKEVKVSIAPVGYLGSMLAVVVSYSLHHSLLWAAIHGIFGWFYIIYYLIVR